MAIKLLTKELEENWRKFVDNSPDSNIYHTLEWKEIAKVFGHEPIYLLSIEESTGQVNGILPLYYVKGLFGRRMVSVSMRDRGGPVSQNGQTLSELLRYALDLAQKRKCSYLELKNIDALFKNVTETLGLQQRKFFVQTQIKIDADKEKMWKGLHKKSVRWAINKSKKEGVVARWRNNREGIEAFYRLFVSTRHKLGVPVFSFQLFENIYKNFISKGWAGCCLAEYKNRPIAGIIFFSYRRTIIEAYAASDQKSLNLQPNNLLIWELLCWGKDNGFRILDLGCDTPNNKNLLKFKSRWGGTQEVVPYYYYYFRKCVLPDTDNPRFNFLRCCWKKFPTVFTKKIGPFLANQMS